MNYDYFLIMKFLISGISILALTQIIFDVLEAKHKSEKAQKNVSAHLVVGFANRFGDDDLGSFLLKEKNFG